MATTIDLGKIRIKWKGDYDAAVTYELLDVCKHKGDSYIFISTIAASAKTPDTTSEWELMVSGGDQWSTGTTVPTGGNPGDMYLKTDDEKIYKNTNGTWAVALDIGGGVWTSGTSAASGGESGDWYMKTDSKTIWENVSGTWTQRVDFALGGSNIQDLGNVPALDSGKFLTNNGTDTSWATVDVAGSSVGGDVSGTISNIQISANTVTDTELNSSKLNSIADSANNYSHPANHAISVITGLQTALDAKTTPGYVNTQINSLIGGAPSTLDTLQELAQAINDDASYASTLTTALATKTAKTSNQSLSSAADAMTISGNTITLNRGDGTTDTVTVPDNNTVYSHPAYDGDDSSIDTGALTGATVISDLDVNVTTDALGHVTDTNATVSTRNLTLANLGYTGAANANYITYTAGSGLTLAGTSFSVQGDLRDGITYVGRDNNDYIEIGTASIDFYINGVKVMSCDASGNIVAKGNITAYGTP